VPSVLEQLTKAMYRDVERSRRAAAGSNQFRPKRFVEIVGERLRGAPLGARARDWARHLYHSALMLQTGGRGLQCMLPQGEVLRALPEHRHMSWNPAEYAAFRAAVGPGMTALDIGANVGAYSLLLGRWVGTSGAVFAFEPAPPVFDGLTRHIQLNDLQRVVHPVAAAVGEREAVVEFVLSATAGESRLAARSDTGESRQVRMVSIDGFCARERLEPDFIKIDVEGFELAVLQGARETIRRRPSFALFVELHPSIWPLIGITRTDVVAELAAQSLEPCPLTPTDNIWEQEGVCVRLRRT
jgi:FkbM family methyltransferase